MPFQPESYAVPKRKPTEFRTQVNETDISFLESSSTDQEFQEKHTHTEKKLQDLELFAMAPPRQAADHMGENLRMHTMIKII